MNPLLREKKKLRLLLGLFIAFLCCGCAAVSGSTDADLPAQEEQPDLSRYLVSIEDEPDTVDFQCTSIYYTIAQNVFNRLIEMENGENGEMEILPSLAQSWQVSEDGKSYTFHLRENVCFSNGSPLTASDVQYTFVRLLTHPGSCNRDIADDILGASELMSGAASELEGFQIRSDLDFTITLEQPSQTFLACLSMPGASILDRETTEQAGPRFGTDPEWTIGTGSFILWKWTAGEGMLLKANPDCWQGAPKCQGLDLRFCKDPKGIRRMFENGELDVLDLDEVGNAAEFFLHGAQYQNRLYHCPRIGIAYIALNETVPPLNDARVRKAMQLALNRSLLLSAVYGGRGSVENGIFPHGLYGFNPDLPEIPFDTEQAKELLEQAGFPEGFDLTVSVNSSSTRWEMSVLRMAASMWEQAGIRANIEVLDESDFMRLRKSGQLACYAALWTADYNDPDNFIYTFFGNKENTTFRSLCYGNNGIMKRVRLARTITDPQERIAEYRELERIIVQQDAAWIPLYSRQRYYVTSKRLHGISSSWNGSVKNMYREMWIEG